MDLMSVRYNKINITFPARVKVDNIIPRNMINNLGCASVDNHIPRDDIFDYHPHRECNIYILSVLAPTFFHLLKTFANSSDPDSDQDQQNVSPDLDLNCLTL